MQARILTPLLVLGLFIAVILQSSQAVSVRFLLWESNMSLIVLLRFAALIGFACGFVLAFSTMRQNKGSVAET